jgi:hypothetical protein
MPGLQMQAPTVDAQRTAPSGAEPYLRFVSNRELEDRKKSDEVHSEQAVIGLSHHLNMKWERAKRAKERIQIQLLKSLRQFNGEYDPEDLEAIRRTGGSEIFMLLTQVKCRASSAWLKDVLLPAGDKAWRIGPTPIADIPDDIDERLKASVMQDAMQMLNEGQNVTKQDALDRLQELRDKVLREVQAEATRRAARMETKMEDQLEEGNWYKAFSEFIDDLVLFKSAFIKGPVMRRRKKLTWAVASVSGNPGHHTPVVKEVVVKEWERRSPFNIYPSPSAKSLDEGYFFDLHHLAPSELESMIGVDGYNDAVIRQVMLEYGSTGYREVLAHSHELAILEQRPYDAVDQPETIDALNFWGSVPGKLLLEWDPKGKIVGNIDPAKSYEVEAWKIGRYVIKAVINPDPLGKRPYSMSSYIKRPGHFWGKGIAEAIEDDQRMINGAARSMSNNMGIASGPQVSITDTSRLPAGEDITSMYPWKIWQFGPDRLSPSGSRKPIEFYQPDPMIRELLLIFDHFSKSADEHAAIPSYVTGGTERVQGAGKTASGLAMLMGQASKSMKLVMTGIDFDVIEPRIKGLYYHNMLYEQDQSIKGDLVVKARGSSALLVREQRQIRLTEFLNLVGGNDIAMGIVGARGFAALMREAAKDLLDIPVDKVVPSEEMIEEQQQQQQADPLEQERIALETKAKDAELGKQANDAAKLELDRERLTEESQQARDAIDSKERIEMAKLDGRAAEARQKTESDANAAAEKDASTMMAELDAYEGELIEGDKTKATEKDDQAVAAVDDMMALMKKNADDMQAILKVMSGEVERLEEIISEQGDRLDESTAFREKIVGYLKKNGTPETQELLG